MKKIGILLLCAALLSGCAHRDLKAPCAENLASLDVVPCDSPVPIGLAFHRTAMANDGSR